VGKKRNELHFSALSNPRHAAVSSQPARQSAGSEFDEMWTREQVLSALHIRLEDYGKGNPCSLAVTFVGKQRKPLNTVNIHIYIYNSVALVLTRTIPTERPPPVGEVSANFCG